MRGLQGSVNGGISGLISLLIIIGAVAVFLGCGGGGNPTTAEDSPPESDCNSQGGLLDSSDCEDSCQTIVDLNKEIDKQECIDLCNSATESDQICACKCFEEGELSDFSTCFQGCLFNDPKDIDDDGDGYTENQGDCDDTDDSIHPGADEICDDLKDNDCDGNTDAADDDCGAPVDTELPIITDFNITPTTIKGGESITADYTTTDNVALAKIELWHARRIVGTCDTGSEANCSWSEVANADISGTSHSGQLTNTPPQGTWLYGLQSVDTSGNTGHEPNGPILVTVNELLVAQGIDPDVAMDANGNAHIAYERSGSIYYREVVGNNIGDEISVGSGFDPQIAVDSMNNPHVVMGPSGLSGIIRYASWNGSGFTTLTIESAAWRKARLAIDSSDRVFVTCERYTDDHEDRLLLNVIQDGSILPGHNSVVLGDEDNGAIDIDSSGLAHFTWRSSTLDYGTYSLDSGVGNRHSFAYFCSDFSWISIDLRDDSIHTVNTVSWGNGIAYRYNDGSWSSRHVLAYDEVSDPDPNNDDDGYDPDQIGPTIDVDSRGMKYIAFSGKFQNPYYIAIDADYNISDVELLSQDTLAGGKLQNPNVGCHSSREGAYFSWGDGNVYLKRIGANP
jgi:hypothetical protein